MAKGARTLQTTDGFVVVSRSIVGKAIQGRKRIELLHDMMEGRDYRQLKI